MTQQQAWIYIAFFKKHLKVAQANMARSREDMKRMIDDVEERANWLKTKVNTLEGGK